MLICVNNGCNNPVYEEESQLYCKSCLQKIDRIIKNYYKKEVM